MTDQPNEPNPYEDWLSARREVSPPANLSDQIMCQVKEWEQQRQGIWWLVLAERIEHRPFARWAVCGGALAVGVLPFLFLARASSF